MQMPTNGNEAGLSAHLGDCPSGLAVGKDAEVADAVVPVQQDVHQDASDEFIGRQTHDAVAALGLALAVRFPVSEADALAVEAGDSAVADGHPVAH